MKTSILSRTLLTIALALGLSASAFAQSYTISNTTTSAAFTASATSVALTSAAASSGSSFGAPAVGQCMFIDGELMTITAIASTTATVKRSSKNAVGHPSGAIVWTAPCNAFKNADPPTFTPKGVGVNGAAANYTQIDCRTMPAPWINVQNGNIWWCNTKNNVLTGTNYAPITYNSVPIAQ